MKEEIDISERITSFLDEYIRVNGCPPKTHSLPEQKSPEDDFEIGFQLNTFGHSPLLEAIGRSLILRASKTGYKKAKYFEFFYLKPSPCICQLWPKHL